MSITRMTTRKLATDPFRQEPNQPAAMRAFFYAYIGVGFLAGRIFIAH